MRRALPPTLAILAIAATGFVSGCSAPEQPDTADASPSPNGIRLVAPEEPTQLGDEVVIVVEITDDDGPVVGTEVTFDVVRGEAAYPGGFDTDVTDSHGVAISLTLDPNAAGTVVVRIATGTQTMDAAIEIVD